MKRYRGYTKTELRKKKRAFLEDMWREEFPFRFRGEWVLKEKTKEDIINDLFGTI